MSQTDPGNSKNDQVSAGSLIWPLALVAWFTYDLLCRGPHSTIGVVLGIVFLFLSLAILLLLIVARVFGKTPSQGASGVSDLNKSIYGGLHKRRTVGPASIVELRLDERFYSARTNELKQFGFTQYSDYVNETLEAAIRWSKTVLRPFLSRDGTIMAAVYCVRFTGLMWFLTPLLGRLKLVDLESELEDGSFVTTSTAQSAGKTLEFPNISRKFFPPETTIQNLLDEHRKHLSEVMATRNIAAAKVFRTSEELFQSQDRQHLMKCAFRNSPEFDPGSEIRKIAGKRLSKEAEEMAAKATELHKNRTR